MPSSSVQPRQADRYREIARAVLGMWPSWQAGLALIAVALGANLTSAFLIDTTHWFWGVTGAGMMLSTVWRVSVLARRAEDSLEPIVATNETAQRSKALVLFLSSAPKTELLDSWMADARFRGGIRSRQVLDAMDGATWRMPFEAIAYHFGELTKVIVIPSRDDVGVLRTVQGTVHHLRKFTDLLDRLCEGHADRPECIGLPELTLDNSWCDGLDFEDAEQLVSALLATFRHLSEKYNLSRSDVIVDVTSGTKVTTVAGAAVSLGKRQKFEYVSTQDYRICLYDVTYRRDVD